MFQLGGSVQVVLALGCFDLTPHLLDFLAQRALAQERRSLRLPLGAQSTGLSFEIGQFLAQVFEAFLTGLVLLLFQRGFLDL